MIRIGVISNGCPLYETAKQIHGDQGLFRTFGVRAARVPVMMAAAMGASEQFLAVIS